MLGMLAIVGLPVVLVNASGTAIEEGFIVRVGFKVGGVEGSGVGCGLIGRSAILVVGLVVS